MTVEKDYGFFKLISHKELGFSPLAMGNKTTDKSSNPNGDWYCQASGLTLMAETFKDADTLRVVEVGTAHGATVRTMYDFLKVHEPNKKILAYGVDSLLHGYDPHHLKGLPDVTFINGKSTDPATIATVPDEINYLFIDGCHCNQHAFIDLTNYAPKVAVGGFIAMHDTHPKFQGGTDQPTTPECDPDDPSIGVVKGIERFGMKGFEFRLQEIPQDKDYGGVTVFQKVA